MKFKIGTRGSDLALTQSRWVAATLAASDIEAELVIISTSGDRSQAPSFGAIGPQGVFVREIEQALLDGRVDCAVHSFKDLPTQSPDGLIVAATPARRDPADWLLYRAGSDERRDAPAANRDDATLAPGADLPPSAHGTALLPLARGARVGTSSARRQAWLRHLRPDLRIEPLRGNVPTRLGRLAAGDYDAIVLAGAGIERLDEAGDVLAAALARVRSHRLDPEHFVPAPAQGALALQCRVGSDAAAVQQALAAIDDAASMLAVDLERQALTLAEGGCDAAFGAWARPVATGYELIIMGERDGKVARARAVGDALHDSLAVDAIKRLDLAYEAAG